MRGDTIVGILIFLLLFFCIMHSRVEILKLRDQVDSLIKYHKPLPTVKKAQPKPKKEEIPHIHDGTPHNH